jgi:hypothetical protein
MRGYLHYNIWNKQEHIVWILRCINYFVPKDTIIDISFEDCQDSSFDLFNQHKNELLSGYELVVNMTNEKYRMKNFNRAIQRFLNTNCDFIISPQDDQFIQDANLFANTINLINSEKEIGIIGMRDGFTFDFKDYYSSHFSIKTPNFKAWLNSGEYKNVKSVNDGALALHRSTIEKVGLFDESMNVFYIETDYCARCIKSGLKNYVLGSELVHVKIGCKSSEVYNADLNFGTIDKQILDSKHPDLYLI